MCNVPEEKNTAHVKHMKGERKVKTNKQTKKKSELNEIFKKQVLRPGSVSMKFYDLEKLDLSFVYLNVIYKMRT